MRNLLDRLKPVHKAKLKELERYYPSTIHGIYSILSNTNFFTEVTFGVAATICSHLDIELNDFMYIFDEE